MNECKTTTMKTVTSPPRDMGKPKRRSNPNRAPKRPADYASFEAASSHHSTSKKRTTVRDAEQREGQGEGMFVRSAALIVGEEMVVDLGFLHRFALENWRPSGVRRLEVSPDGKWLALARGSGAVELWETHHWTCLKRLAGREGCDITALQWIQDSTDAILRLFATTLDGKLMEWSLETGDVESVAEVSGGGIWAMAPAPLRHPEGGVALGLACDDGAVRFYRIDESAGCEFLGLLSSDSSRGSEMAVGYADGSVRLWSLLASPSANRNMGHERLRIRVGSEEASVGVWSVLCLEDVIVCGDATGRVHFWDRSFGTLLSAFHKHDADVSLLMPLREKDVQYVLSAGMDASVVIFRQSKADASWSYLHRRRPHLNDITCWAVCRQGLRKTLLTGSEDCLVHCITCAAEEDLVQAFLNKRLRTLDATPERPQFQTVNARIVLAIHPRDIDFWLLPQNPEVDLDQRLHGETVGPSRGPVLKARLSLPGPTHIRIAAVSPDRQFLALSSGMKTKLIRIRDLDDNAVDRVAFQPVKLRKPLPPSCQLKFAHDASVLWLVDLENGMRAVELPSMRLFPRVMLELPKAAPFRLHPSGLCLSPDGQQMAYFVHETLFIYALRPAGVQLLHRFRNPSPLVALTFEGNGRCVFASAAQPLRRYDTEQGLFLSDLYLHEAFDPRVRPHTLTPRQDDDLLVAGASAEMQVVVAGRLRNLPLAKERRSLYVEFLSKDTLLSIEADWHQVLQKLSPPVYRHRYGS